MLSSSIEIATGLALIAISDLDARVLLGAELSGGGIAVARLTLGLSCRPGDDEPTAQATRALFIDNLLAGLHPGYLRVGGGFVGYLLELACALYVALPLLLARPAYGTFRQE